MKSTLVGSVLLCASSFLALGPMNAQSHPKHKIDSNDDGVVEFNEMQAMHPDLTLEEFNKMDTNSDGQLVPDELVAAHMAKRMERIDTDGDGAISYEEMESHRPPHADAAERFKQFDSNEDGKLTQEELKAMHEEMRKHMPEFGKFRERHPVETEESDE